MPLFAFDAFTVVGGVFGLITFVSFWRVSRHQYFFVRKNPSSFRAAVLSVRAAGVIPGFALCYWLSLFIPYIYAAMQIPEALLQAYCVVCFFSLIAYYVGGPQHCVAAFAISTNTQPSCIFGCMNKQPQRCYAHAYLAIWQFMFVRPVVTVAMCVAFYMNQNDLSLVISFLTSVQAAWGVGGLVKFYHVLYDYCKGLNMTKKIVAIKTIIGLILLQGFLEEVLFYFGFIDVKGGIQAFSAEDNAIRAYCFAVLAELVLFCIWVECVFSYNINTHKGKNFKQTLTNNDYHASRDNAVSTDIQTNTLTDCLTADEESESIDSPTTTATNRFADAESAYTYSTSVDVSNIKDMTYGAFLAHLFDLVDVFDGMKLDRSLALPSSGDVRASGGNSIASPYANSHNRNNSLDFTTISPSIQFPRSGSNTSTHSKMEENIEAGHQANPMMNGNSAKSSSSIALSDRKPSPRSGQV